MEILQDLISKVAEIKLILHTFSFVIHWRWRLATTLPCLQRQNIIYFEYYASVLCLVRMEIIMITLSLTVFIVINQISLFSFFSIILISRILFYVAILFVYYYCDFTYILTYHSYIIHTYIYLLFISIISFG